MDVQWLEAKKAQIQQRQQELTQTAAKHENTIRQEQAAIEQIRNEWNQNIGRLAQIDEQLQDVPDVTRDGMRKAAPGPRPVREIVPPPPMER
jgi:uncharacterized protein YnzC (UPF0291/DUF896 family)